MILSAQFRPRLMAALHVFAYAHGSNTPFYPRTTPPPPPHEFRARTYFRVVCTFARRLNLPQSTTPLRRRISASLHASLCLREIPKGASLFRLIATNSAQTTSTPLVDTDLLLSPLLFLAGFTPSPTLSLLSTLTRSRVI